MEYEYKTPPEVIDVEIVKNFNWLKLTIKEKYYLLRSKWWNCKNIFKNTMVVEMIEWIVSFILISSIATIGIMALHTIYSLMGIDMSVLIGLIMLIYTIVNHTNNNSNKA